MKTISKNLKIFSLLISIGSMALLASACGGSGSQAQGSATELIPALLDNEPKPAAEKPAETAAPVAPPKTCYIYSFVSDREANAENVFLADTCNSQGPRRLTGNTDRRTHFGSLAFTSDGTKLAFDRLVSSFARNFPTPNLMTLPSSPAQLPLVEELSSDDLGGAARGDFLPQQMAFETHGDRIAFVGVTPLSAIPVGPGVPALRVFPKSLKVFDPERGVDEIVSNGDETVEIDSPTWHPDGRRIFYSMSNPFLNAVTLNVFDLNTRQNTAILEQVGSSFLLGGLRGTSPVIRPDGREMAFVRFDGDLHQIFVCALDERSQFGPSSTICRDPHPLTNLRENSDPSYTPDGQFILFTSSRDGNREIYQMRDDGSEQVNLTQNLSEDRGVAVSPVTFQIPGN